MHRTLLAVAIWAVVSCTPAPAGSAGSPTPAASPSPTLSGEPQRTAIPTSSPEPAPPEPIVRANALGSLTGNWLFVGKQVPHSIRAEVQIWAVPLDGGAAKLAFAYDVSVAGAPEGIFDTAPYLRRQFSPDGTRMVVSVDGRLIVVDLVTGQTKPLGVIGSFPSWSKDGSRIAFLFETPVVNVVPPEGAIGVIPAAGGQVKQLAVVGYARQSVEWSPDAAMVMLTQPDGIAIVDAASGRIARTVAEVSSPGSSFAHWRARAPQIAVATFGCEKTQSTTKLIGFDDAEASQRTMLDTGELCTTLNLRDPRWNPAGDELLYVATRAGVGAMPHEYRVHLLDIRSGRDATLPMNAWEATWTRDGTRIAYLARGPDWSYGNAVRLWRRDGGGERELLTATGNEFFFSIASLSY